MSWNKCGQFCVWCAVLIWGTTLVPLTTQAMDHEEHEGHEGEKERGGERERSGERERRRREEERERGGREEERERGGRGEEKERGGSGEEKERKGRRRRRPRREEDRPVRKRDGKGAAESVVPPVVPSLESPVVPPVLPTVEPPLAPPQTPPVVPLDTPTLEAPVLPAELPPVEPPLAPPVELPATPPVLPSAETPVAPPVAPLAEQARGAELSADDRLNLQLQGEYEGVVVSQVGDLAGVSTAGLQVVSLAGNRFSGVLYPRGLPGTGWLRGVTYRLTGSRESSDRLELRGEALVIRVTPAGATVHDERGTLLAQLDRVRRRSATMGLAAPPTARVLFDGTSTAAFRNGRIDADGHLMVGTELVDLHQNFVMHAEFRIPFMPEKAEQARGNSGIYLQSRYEVQILDSFGLPRAFNECGSLYRQRTPEINMCLPPVAWQTYDLRFRSPVFNQRGQKLQNARLTLWHNGVLVQDNIEVLTKTGAGQPEGPELLPIRFQDHGDPVVFRNVWILDQP